MVLFISLVLVGIVVRLLQVHLHKVISRTSNESTVIVQLPRYYVWIGLVVTICTLALLILMIIFPNDTATIWVGILFGCFILLGISIIIATLVWKIYLTKGDDHFIYTTFFGRTHKIYYKNITHYKWGVSTTKLKVGKKSFFVETQAINSSIFLKELKRNKVPMSDEPTILMKMIAFFIKLKK